MKIAIIGTAGRGEDKNKMNKALYIKMVRDALTEIEKRVPNKEDRHLVSGGAAWSDHIAVSLALMGYAESLTLYLPCKWENERFVDFPNMNTRFCISSTADTANYYHYLFSEKMRGNTLGGIQDALDKGAKKIEIKGGFKARNLLVGDADILLAYTFGEGDIPKDGGTKHTWDNSKAPVKIHRSLTKL